MNKNKIIIIVVAILAIVGVGYYVGVRNSDSDTQQVENVELREISYSGEDTKSVCDILKEEYDVVSTESSFGEMVTSINGLASSDSEFWLYQVNGESGEVSCDQQMTTSSDTVLWEYKGM